MQLNRAMESLVRKTCHALQYLRSETRLPARLREMLDEGFVDTEGALLLATASHNARIVDLNEAWISSDINKYLEGVAVLDTRDLCRIANT